MSNNEYIVDLINRSNNYWANLSRMTDDEILKLYYDIVKALKSDRFSEKEKNYIRLHTYLESLAIMKDGIERENK